MVAGPYTRTVYTGGGTLNLRTIEMLLVSERRAGLTIPVGQGSYNAGVAASGGTHDGGGVFDVRVATLTTTERERVVWHLRRTGFAAWLRTPSQGDWPYHIHAVAIGDKEMSPQAAWQVIEYKAGRNGLASRGPDDGPDVPWTEYRQGLDMSFYGPENWDEADWGRFADKGGWKYNILDLVKADGSVRDASKMLSFIHVNGSQTETAANAALSAANGAQVAASHAETAANEAKNASLVAVSKANEILAVVNPPA